MAMERLTWRQVDAPNMTGAAGMMSAGNRILQDALSGIGQLAGTAKENQMNKYSADVLLRAAQMTDPAQARAFLEQARVEGAGRLNEGALDYLTNLQDNILATKEKGLNVQDLELDLRNQEYLRDRTRDTNSALDQNMPAIVQAKALAQAGDFEGSQAILAGVAQQAPILGATLVEGLDDASAGYTWNQGAREKDRDWNQSNHAKAISDQARDIVQGNIFSQGVVSPEDAKQLATQIEGMSPELQLAVNEQIDKRFATDTAATDVTAAPYDPFNKNNKYLGNLTGSQNKAAFEEDFARVNADLETDLNNNAAFRLEKTKEQIGDFGLDPKAKLQEVLGMDDDAYSQAEIDNSISRIQSKLRDDGIEVTEADVAAAIAAEAKTAKWGMPWISSVDRGDRAVNEDASLELLRNTHGATRKALYDEMGSLVDRKAKIGETKQQADAFAKYATQLKGKPRAAGFQDQADLFTAALVDLVQETDRKRPEPTVGPRAAPDSAAERRRKEKEAADMMRALSGYGY